jgi:hypothetical protein
VLIVATLAAAFFGLVPLLVPAALAQAVGLATNDLFVYRLAGAATFGYAVAGALSLRARYWFEIRVQTIAATVFNGASALAAVAYVIGGGTSLLGPLLVVAATRFTVTLIAGLLRS